MKLIPLEELYKQDLSLHRLHAVMLRPVNSFYRQPPSGRECSMLILMEEGRCCFEYNGKQLEIEPGMILYLSQGGYESYRGLDENIRYIRIGFRICDEKGEDIRCAEEPLLLQNATDETGIALCRELPEAFLSDSFRAYGLLYQLLSHLSRNCGKSEMNHLQKRLLPAVDYMEKNCIREMISSELAAMCHLSETHFRRIFKACYGVSPMTYRNQLRIRLACRLLQNEQYSVTEIADQLGFESVYYFDRVFKQIMQISPSQWRREQ